MRRCQACPLKRSAPVASLTTGALEGTNAHLVNRIGATRFSVCAYISTFRGLLCSREEIATPDLMGAGRLWATARIHINILHYK